MTTATRSRSASSAALALVLAGGCATTVDRPPASPSRVVPIVYLENQPLRPMVELKIGESVGWFLLDTGAAGHVMSDWFFRAAFPGRPLRGAPGTAVDFSGVPIPITVVSDVGATWKDGKRTALRFGVGPFSQVGDADGMAGVLSPQRLAGERSIADAIELDFLRGELRWWPQPPSLGVPYSVEANTLQVCAAGTHGAVVYAWATAIDGEPVWAMMDSGSPVTAVSSEHPAGQRLLPRSVAISSGRGVSRAPIETRAAAAQLDFGGLPWRGNIAVMKLPLQSCGTGALIGMNVLRRCSVTMAGAWGSVACVP